ncbi:hypothetical protein KI387_012657, partial [Taxus chinensis]
KETTKKRIRKLKLNEDAEELKESVLKYPTPPENVEEPNDEDMKYGEQREKETDETMQETTK